MFHINRKRKEIKLGSLANDSLYNAYLYTSWDKIWGRECKWRRKYGTDGFKKTPRKKLNLSIDEVISSVHFFFQENQMETRKWWRHENGAPQTGVLKYGWKSLWKITP